jgi:hypothetical protein
MEKWGRQVELARMTEKIILATMSARELSWPREQLN